MNEYTQIKIQIIFIIRVVIYVISCIALTPHTANTPLFFHNESSSSCPPYLLRLSPAERSTHNGLRWLGLF